ncbi:MAG: DUF86 domain-containing protein [Brevinematales bacterium]|nr:DUF86 domain-containing protein [Brevinematales bacterium]
MSNDSDVVKLHFILEIIEDIEEIIKKYFTIEKAFNDVTGYHALTMCLLQIGEKIEKIHGTEYRKALPVKKVYHFRNILAHEYENIDIQLAKSLIENDIPEMKKIISNLLDSLK